MWGGSFSCNIVMNITFLGGYFRFILFCVVYFVFFGKDLNKLSALGENSHQISSNSHQILNLSRCFLPARMNLHSSILFCFCLVLFCFVLLCFSLFCFVCLFVCFFVLFCFLFVCLSVCLFVCFLVYDIHIKKRNICLCIKGVIS